MRCIKYYKWLNGSTSGYSISKRNEAPAPLLPSNRTDQRLQYQALYGIEPLDWLMRHAYTKSPWILARRRDTNLATDVAKWGVCVARTRGTLELVQAVQAVWASASSPPGCAARYTPNLTKSAAKLVCRVSRKRCSGHKGQGVAERGHGKV